MKLILKRKSNGKVLLNEKEIEDLRRMLKDLDRVEIVVTTKDLELNLDPQTRPRKQFED